ncbi:MAG: glycosyltransferase family 2 protein [Acidobacteriota bacterium]|nr:glycosyltransferase family 2 protein [Acidobacteriota bacterium]
MPTVTVIMPAYRVTAYIADALDSVFRQTYTDYEVIVINDCCPDTANLERVLAPYLARIRYLKQDQNTGPAGARNTGLHAATTPYVALLDADDLWEPKYLETHIGMLQADPSLDVVYGNARLFGNTADVGRLSMDLLPSSGEVNFASLITLQCNVNISSTARREALLKAGGFDPSQRRCEDFDLWLRLAKAGGKFAYHRQVLMHYRKHDASLSSNIEAAWLGILDLYEKVKRTMDLTPDEIELVDKQSERFRAELAFAQGKAAFEAGRMEEAVSYLRQAQAYFHNRKLATVLALIRIAPRAVLWAHRLRSRRSVHLWTSPASS